MVGGVGDLPFGRLDVDRARPGSDAVLAGMVGVQVAVGDGGDVADRDAGVCQGVLDPPGGRVVRCVELLVAEPETRIEQERCPTPECADRVTP